MLKDNFIVKTGWLLKKKTPISIFFVFLLSMGVIDYSYAIHITQISTPNLIYSDNFETETNWQIFEEIVGGNTCYGDGIGSVARSMDVAYEGNYGLLVWANEARSEKSNHVIGYKNISEEGLTGVIRYQIQSYVPSETALQGQTGPEFSMQNTRFTGATTTTAIAGVQYIANPYWKTGFWKVWDEGAWTTFLTTTLSADTWYTFTLEANYLNNQYSTFSIQGGDIDLTEDLSSYQISEEARGFTEAFVITLESENIWNNCGTAGNFDYKIYYDQIAVTQNLTQIYLPHITNLSP